MGRTPRDCLFPIRRAYVARSRVALRCWLRTQSIQRITREHQFRLGHDTFARDQGEVCVFQHHAGKAAARELTDSRPETCNTRYRMHVSTFLCLQGCDVEVEVKAIATLSLRKAGFALYRRRNRYEFVTNYRGFSPTIKTPIPNNFSQMLCKSPSSCMLSRKHHPPNY